MEQMAELDWPEEAEARRTLHRPQTQVSLLAARAAAVLGFLAVTVVLSPELQSRVLLVAAVRE
jgi:hypothetical protein